MPRLPMPSDTEAFAEKTRAAVRHILPHGGHGGTVERRHTACLSGRLSRGDAPGGSRAPG